MRNNRNKCHQRIRHSALSLTFLRVLGSRAHGGRDGMNLDDGLHSRNFGTTLIPNIQNKQRNAVHATLR
jgi:hypothetical protein